MALFENPTGTDADLPFFNEGQSQPAGSSILWIRTWWNPRNETNPDFARRLTAYEYDWSRIAAALIDEPYWYNTGATDPSNPCRNPADPRNGQISKITMQLADAAAVIRNISPSTRLWVNFSVPEMQWASDGDCPIPINDWYIDVISLDAYWGTFKELAEPHYNWLSQNRATEYQQLALVPGTFFRDGVDDQALMASYLEQYFEYANASNGRCNLPLGRVGVTGYWDGCLVWLVAGWLASSPRGGGQVWRGALDPLSWQISATWKAQLAYPKLDPLLGEVESYDGATRTFTGWAFSGNSADQPAYVDLWVDREHWAGGRADRPSSDIGRMYGRDRAGFSITVPGDRVLRTCRVAEVYAVAPGAQPYDHVLLSGDAKMQICP